MAPLGVPAIDGLGPRGAGFHTTTEYVELATFVPKAEALRALPVGAALIQPPVHIGCAAPHVPPPLPDAPVHVPLVHSSSA